MSDEKNESSTSTKDTSDDGRKGETQAETKKSDASSGNEGPTETANPAQQQPS